MRAQMSKFPLRCLGRGGNCCVQRLFYLLPAGIPVDHRHQQYGQAAVQHKDDRPALQDGAPVVQAEGSQVALQVHQIIRQQGQEGGDLYAQAGVADGISNEVRHEQQQLRDCEKGIENVLNAIQMGILTASTKERLEQLEQQREALKTSILQAQITRPQYDKKQIVQWISRFKYGNINDKAYQREIIDVFVNSVYVYDDKLVLTYNFKDGTQTITLKEIEDALSSDMTCIAPP